MKSVCWTVLALAVGATSVTADTDDAARVLERMREAQSRMTTLAARIEQVKSFPQLGIEDPPETGLLFVERGRSTRVRLEIREPEVRILTSDDGEYLLYQPRIKQAISGRLAGGGAKGLFSGILTGSAEATEELSRDYVLAAPNDHAEPGVVALRFTAKPGRSVYCQKIDLWVDESTFLPVRQSCHEANDSVITFTLSEVQVGVSLDKDTFEVDVPSDVERVKG